MTRTFSLLLLLLVVARRIDSFQVALSPARRVVARPPKFSPSSSPLPLFNSFQEDDNNNLENNEHNDSVAVLTAKLQELTQPIQNTLDTHTDGWALSYANLAPDSPNTPIGQSFLATNIAYAIAGTALSLSGEYWMGFCIEVAAIASFNYHYNQLRESSAGEVESNAVRFALILDYTAAAVSMVSGLIYITTASALPIPALLLSVLGVFFLFLSWVYEYGRPYMFWHSLWHVCSAYAGYLIGVSHLESTML